MDGIDVAMVRTDGQALVEFGPTLAVEYSAEFRRRIEAGLLDASRISDRRQRPGSTSELEQELTDYWIVYPDAFHPPLHRCRCSLRRQPL